MRDRLARRRGKSRPAAMFTMMNEARLGVGVQGLALSEVAYQNAVAYAKERLQGRSLTGPKFPTSPPIRSSFIRTFAAR
jgi:alkylation response protein AidB-like acyl-CoA dehydrogenase